MQTTRRLRFLLPFGTLITLVFLASCANQSDPKVYISDCGAGISERPSSITLACADGGISLRHISYSAWNSKVASGSATLLVVCREVCPNGQTENHVTFSLTNPKKSKVRELVFSKIKIYAKSILYNGSHSDAFDIGIE
jgi:hypothetical protein